MLMSVMSSGRRLLDSTQDAAIPGQLLPAQMNAISSVCAMYKLTSLTGVAWSPRQIVQTICPVGLGLPVSRQLHDEDSLR